VGYTVCRIEKAWIGDARPTFAASQSIALNIAKGAARFGETGVLLSVASGSARECGAILDILDRCGVLISRPRATVRTSGRIVAADTDDRARKPRLRRGHVYGNEEGNGNGGDRGAVRPYTFTAER
jgi:hypothetical protein